MLSFLRQLSVCDLFSTSDGFFRCNSMFDVPFLCPNKEEVANTYAK